RAPLHRFSFLLAKALERCSAADALAARYLSTREKQDSEGLALLRHTLESKMLDAARQVRLLQIDEADRAVAAAQRAIDGARLRQTYYANLVHSPASDLELTKELLGHGSSVLRFVASEIEAMAGVLHIGPNIQWRGTAHGSGKLAFLNFGAEGKAGGEIGVDW